MSATILLIGQVLQLDNKNQYKLDLNQAFLTNRSETVNDGILSNVMKVTENSGDKRLQFLLLCAQELSSIDVISQGGPKAELLAAYFIKACLQLES